MAEVNQEPNQLKKKYSYTKITTITGITKPVAVLIAKFGLGSNYINIVHSYEKRKYIVVVKSSVSEKVLNNFKSYWKDTFIVQKLSE